jgi:hypothetical protein
MVTEEMRKQITQAIQSQSSIVTNQRTDPHCLVPERETSVRYLIGYVVIDTKY